MEQKVLTRTRGQEIFEKSKEVIASGVNSPVRAFIGLEMDPMIVQRGQGDQIWDADGRCFIDFCMSWGALLLGHAPKTVVEKAIEQVKKGSSFGIATEAEEALARKITSLMPSIEVLRFVSSGTEATMSAVRVARGYTNRPLIVKFNGNYHGHADHFLVKAGSGVSQTSATSSSKGIPEEIVKHTISLPYNDYETVQTFLRDPLYKSQIAAVIVEPIAANMGVVPAMQKFLKMLREETKRSGALLIFDEVISGLRVGLNGAQGLYQIEPDLTCLGKIVGGGFPAAAFGGRRDVMDVLAPKGGVYQAGTLSGNPVAMQAGLETLCQASEPKFYEQIEAKTRLITDPIEKAIKDKKLDACIHVVTGMFTIFWGIKEVKNFEDLSKLKKDQFRRFFQYLYERGIYFPPSPYEACFISAAHTEEHLIKARDVILEFIDFDR